jgi:Carboxypeptidase regulatory-like domain
MSFRLLTGVCDEPPIEPHAHAWRLASRRFRVGGAQLPAVRLRFLRVFTHTLTLAVLLGVPGVGQNQGGRITGTVIDAVSRQPVPRAVINVMPPPGPGIGTSPTAARTDANGTFSFDAPVPGEYGLMVSEQQNYTATSNRMVRVQAGEETSVTIELMPAPVVSGRVVDEDGDPMRGCIVNGHPAGRPDQQRGTGVSNENGEYRMRALAAGKYFFSAHCSDLPFIPRPFSSGPDPPASLAYPVEYFPLTTELKAAQAVTLAAGVEKSGVDFQMRPAPVVEVRGSLSGTDWRAVGGGLGVLLIPAGERDRPQSANNLDPEKNMFSFERVFPGSYDVVAFANAGEKSMTAIARIEVKDRPVEVVLTPVHNLDVTGTVTLDDNSSGKPVALSQVRIALDDELPIGFAGHVQVSADGTFTLKGLAASRYRLMVNGAGIFAKSVWLGNADVTGGTIDLTSGAPQNLRIVVSTNTGTITGSVPQGDSVIAWAEGYRSMTYGGRADGSGHYMVSGVAPGTYSVCIARVGLPGPDESCPVVTVHEGETVNVDVKAPSQ